MTAVNSSPAAPEKPLSAEELDGHRARVRDLSNAHAKRIAGKRLVRKNPRLREIFETAELAENLKTDNAALAAALGKSKETIAGLEASVGTYQVEAKTSAAALASLRAQLAATEKSLAEAGARIADLEKSEAAAKAENVANLALLDAANAELVKVRADLAAALKKAKPAGGQ